MIGNDGTKGRNKVKEGYQMEQQRPAREETMQERNEERSQSIRYLKQMIKTKSQGRKRSHRL
jgi:hypothetical protein